jgi:uncharacterized membrane protein YphA (DoxX/SURF4 family)
MDESRAETAEDDAGPRELPQWKTWLSAVSAVLLALAFIVAGVWKVTDPVAAAVRMAQAQVPQMLSLPAALAFGISETFAGVLLLAPRFRRWGAWLAGLLLVAFMVYMGLFYNVLRGEECNCFPWVKRAVGPAFFIGDAIMLSMAVVAGWWARPSKGPRTAAIVLGAVCVFALVSYGVTAARQTGVRAPQFVTVNGKPFPLGQGRVFLFFFNPQCLHCDHSARELAKLDWGQTAVVAVTTQLPQFGPEFLSSTQLRGVLTSDVEPLRKIFSFVDVPFGVALENGHQRASFTNFDGKEPADALRKLGFVK